MHVVTGTEQTRTEHSTGAAGAGVAISVGIPVLIALAGIWTFGWDAISWPGAIIWGIVGAAGFSLAVAAAKSMGYTSIDFADLLGSMFARPGTAASQWTGMMVHFVNGALLAVAFLYGLALVDAPVNWFTGAIWGAIVWVHSLILLTSLGAVHPAIRSGAQHDPGTAGRNFGVSTPWVSLVGHLVYGVLVGWLYQAMPLT